MFYRLIHQNPLPSRAKTESDNQKVRIIQYSLKMGNIYLQHEHPRTPWVPFEKSIFSISDIVATYPECFAAVTADELLDLFNRHTKEIEELNQAVEEIGKRLEQATKQAEIITEEVQALSNEKK